GRLMNNSHVIPRTHLQKEPAGQGNRGKSIFVVLVAALCATGCASMHNLKPQARLGDIDDLASAKSLRGVPRSESAWPTTDWWTRFNDPQLDRLVQEALSGNPSLKAAQARVRKALALAGVAGAARFPQIEGRGTISEQRFSERGVVPPPFAGHWSSENRLAVNLSYDLDFWGRNRSAYESALDQAKAAAVDAYAARLFISASVAHAYVELQHAYNQLDVANETLKQRQHILDLTRDRVAAGLDTRLELKQAESALPATREQIAALNETIQLTQNQLAALLGQGPDRGLVIARPQPQELGAVALPTNLPADLIGRRPDVIAQRWRVQASSKDIDVAKAEFYPNINLTAFVGLESLGLGKFLETSSGVVGVGPAVSLPIFTGGRLTSNLSEKNADFDIAVEQYNETLVNALREVVDQLDSFRSVDEQRQQLQIALSAAQDAYDLSLLRYQGGVGNYLQVLSAESQVLAQKGLATDLNARELDLSINLIRALGGGYDVRASAPTLGSLK
ncbi:MAG TPA: efflux transporter outer membrane subunit, partial [Candidatus Acidoferrales bacterium]|nr:efflux transporter outer membrane subunit [Candidatus Acidoferrales bacterium]